MVDPDEFPGLPPERVFEVAAGVAGQARDEAVLLADGLGDDQALEAAAADQAEAVRYAELAVEARERRREHESAVAWSLGVRPDVVVTVEPDTDDG
jgi:hypothetical protein